MVNEPANDTGRIGASDRESRHPALVRRLNKLIECSQKCGVSEAKRGVHHDRCCGASMDAGDRRTIDLCAPQMLTIDGEIAKTNVANPFGFGAAHRVRDRTSVDVGGPRTHKGALRECFNFTQRKDRHMVDRIGNSHRGQ